MGDETGASDDGGLCGCGECPWSFQGSSAELSSVEWALWESAAMLAVDKMDGDQ